MKITKLYFQSVRVFWDCFQCGGFNVEEINLKNSKNGVVLLKCPKCLSRRKGKINILSLTKQNPVYPFSNVSHKKKMKTITKKFNEKQIQESRQKKKDYIKSLKKGKKK